MKTVLMAACAAASALTAGHVLAATKHSADTAASPQQAIPYAQLDAYLKASPAQRAKQDWWSGQVVASTGAGANTSATTASPDAAPPSAQRKHGPVGRSGPSPRRRRPPRRRPRSIRPQRRHRRNNVGAPPVAAGREAAYRVNFWNFSRWGMRLSAPRRRFLSVS